jgi:hypothetical protein
MASNVEDEESWLDDALNSADNDSPGMLMD